MNDKIGSSQSLPAFPSAPTRPITTERFNTKNGPQETDFKIPSSKEEFNKINFNLISAGSSKSENKQIITMWQTAYNRACLEYMKANTTITCSQTWSKETCKKIVNTSHLTLLP
jgi:hypothetical protein